MCTHDQLSTDSGLSILFEMLYLVVFFILGFTPCKAEQPLQGMELQEREAQKD